jgi:two-component system, response regulator, stage 0 sporulation protein F
MSDKTILCVDDEADILELFKDEFLDSGYNVLEASNGVEAFEVFMDNTVDCIVSDIRMPGGDGVELVKSVKSVKGEGSDIPIFLVTGFSDYTSEELTGLGVNAVIFKPFDLEEVVDMVKSTIEKS